MGSIRAVTLAAKEQGGDDTERKMKTQKVIKSKKKLLKMSSPEREQKMAFWC